MYEISCEMCMDLIPLVRDGVSCEDTQKAVMHHIQSCDTCRALYEDESMLQRIADKALLKAIKRVQAVSKAVMLAIVLLGIFLCEMVMQGSSMFFVLVVLGICGLLRIAFPKGDEKRQRIKRFTAFAMAAVMIVGVIWAGNELFGNPVVKNKAESHIQGYLEGAFPDTDYYIEKVLYNWSGSYEGEIRSASDPELRFYVSYRDGKIIYDTYNEHVLDIWE